MSMQKHLQFAPTQDQAKALAKLESFVQKSCSDDFFILKGSAGTGKTTILKAVTDYLHANEVCFRLCAPTGRAAKIISSKTERIANTMHSEIYLVDNNYEGTKVKLNAKQNKDVNYSIFIVDESSMVSDFHEKFPEFITPNPLLTDFIRYIKQGNKDNKVIFVGDTYQLPPVVKDLAPHLVFSPALTLDYISKQFSLVGQEASMTEVMRQKDGNPVLNYANQIRNASIAGKLINPIIPRHSYWQKGLLHYLTTFDHTRIDSTAVICYTNKDVDWWNKTIRKELGKRGILDIGDHVIIQESSFNKLGSFIKGDSGIINEIKSPIEKYCGLSFQDVVIQVTDLKNEIKYIETKVLLDSVSTKSGKLHSEIEKNLIASAMKHNSKYRESKQKSDDKYLSALRLRHSFAITCHKAQGGEWDNVLIHPFRMYKI